MSQSQRSTPRARLALASLAIGAAFAFGACTSAAATLVPTASAAPSQAAMNLAAEVDATVAGLRAHGAELVGEVAQYQDSYRLCYVRGPEGIIVALAEQLS